MLLIGTFLLIFIGFVHSYLGEKYILYKSEIFYSATYIFVVKNYFLRVIRPIKNKLFGLISDGGEFQWSQSENIPSK